MARSIRSADFESRTARLKLPRQGKPFWLQIAKGIALGYRRNATNGAWVVRSTRGGVQWVQSFAVADDFEEADAESILNFYDAQRRARDVARGSRAGSGGPITVAVALARYKADLTARGKEAYNADLAKTHLPPSILGKPVSLVTARELRDYRDGLARTHKPASVNRIICPLKAALSLAASLDRERIPTESAWTDGLKPLSGATRSRNVVLREDQVRAIVAAAYEDSCQFGLLVETAALTGARYSQLARIRVDSVQADRCRVIVPSSKKGRGTKQIQSRPVTITAGLAIKLQKVAEGRAPGEYLLAKPDGSQWRAKHQGRPFALAAKTAGLDPAKVTLSALRHTSITALLVKGLPIRAVAERHDTSVRMIEQTYGASITEFSDALFEKALPDLAPASVIPMRVA